MKIKNECEKRKVFKFLHFAVIFCCLWFLLSCDTEKDNSNGSLSAEGIAERERLAFLHTSESHETSEYELQNMLNEFIHITPNDSEVPERQITQTNAPKITDVIKFNTKIENGFSSINADKRTALTQKEETNIPFYVFKISGEEDSSNGFALVCGDDRIGNILAVTEGGAFDEINPFLYVYYANLEDYIKRTIATYNDITDEEIQKAKENAEKKQTKETTRATVLNYKKYEDNSFEPLVTSKIKWSQNAPYNDIIKSYYNEPYITGCVATAMAQVIAFYEWPQYSKSFKEPKYGATVTSYNNTKYEWEKIKLSPYAGYIYDANVKRQIGILFFEVASNVNMNFGTNSSGAYASNIPTALEKMGYKKPQLINYDFSTIKASLDAKKPVIISAAAIKETKTETEYFLGFIPILTTTTTTYKSGHAWIIDDYCIVKLMQLKNGVHTQYGTEYLVYCNLGWGANSATGWYKSGVFDTNSATISRSVRSVGTIGNYQFDQKIIPHITKS